MTGRAAGMVRLLLQLCDAILGICTMMESSDSHRVAQKGVAGSNRGQERGPTFETVAEDLL